MLSWLLLFGLLSGITTWLFGFGGGFVTVPLIAILLTHGYAADSAVAQAGMQIAVATSAVVMLFSATVATLRHARAGSLPWRSLSWLLLAVALGSMVGAVAASQLSGKLLHRLFIIYLLLTLLDCAFRPGFLDCPSTTPSRPGLRQDGLTGILIGTIAAMLGVGGSVMSLPLMRRRGYSMADAAAIANLLTLPIAAMATFTWLGMTLRVTPDFGTGFIGFIWFQAALILAASAWFGMRVARYATAHLPDRWHARTYLLLLATVLIAMLIWR